MKICLPIPSWSQQFQHHSTSTSSRSSKGFVYLLGKSTISPESARQKMEGRNLSRKSQSHSTLGKSASIFEDIVRRHGQDWQVSDLLLSQKELLYFVGRQGPVWILRCPPQKEGGGHYGLLDESIYTWTRDVAGSLVGHFKVHQIKNVDIEFINSSPDQELGLLVGVNMAAYSFKQCREGKYLHDLPQVCLIKGKKSLDSEICLRAARMAEAINVARHMVNLPPNELNPLQFASLIEKGFSWSNQVVVKVWDTDRLKKEGMGLLLAVGSGGSTAPCMVHLKYRPLKKSKLKPIAFVGKGITFDSGGLDIKPSAAMRLMKKDMGGAAALLGLAHWVSESSYTRACDFYFALAENMVDRNSMRPGDVYKTRSGIRIEIDNTDAEGRLVMADVIDVAATAKGEDDPEFLIDVATLTGAIKVALGADIAGLFSNDDQLADLLLTNGVRYGDPCWRMPLVERYFTGLNSSFADFKNSTEGFGGAITASLFLQKFIRNKKWAHLDIYAWADKALGPHSFVGGSGQGVSSLIGLLSAISFKRDGL